ncbi:GH39 family glycosyl hydrolase [Cellulomonas sp. P5_C6]
MTETVIVPASPLGPMPDAWRRCIGTGRMNLALRADYQASLARVQREIGFTHIRGHGLLSDDMGLLRTDDVGGRSHRRYSFTYVDQVHDYFLSLGIKPFLELGFMPSALASGPETVFWWKGNITPPADVDAWVDLVQALLRHLIDRYGIDEVRTWPIEVWNEPNLDIFWKDADQDAYFRLYAATARAVKDVDASLQIGGPALAPGCDAWWSPFAEFVERHDVPVDFVSRHAYSSYEPAEIPFGTYQRLMPPSALLDQFAEPRVHLAGTRLADLPVHITEFNTSYRPDNPIHDTAYNAAYLAPVLAAGGDLVDSFSYWTFSDVFEELNIPTSIFHGGFGLLTHRQIAKPTFHLYAFMARLASQVLARGEDHLVCTDPDGRLTVLAWQPVGAGDGPAADSHELALSVPCSSSGSPLPDGSGMFVRRERVNETAGNAFTAWRELGRPASPTVRQLDDLQSCATPALEHSRLTVADGRVTLRLSLSQHEVTLVELTPVVDTIYDGLDDRRLLGGVDDRFLLEHER